MQINKPNPPRVQLHFQNTAWHTRAWLNISKNNVYINMIYPEPTLPVRDAPFDPMAQPESSKPVRSFKSEYSSHKTMTLTRV